MRINLPAKLNEIEENFDIHVNGIEMIKIKNAFFIKGEYNRNIDETYRFNIPIGRDYVPIKPMVIKILNRIIEKDGFECMFRLNNQFKKIKINVSDLDKINQNLINQILEINNKKKYLNQILHFKKYSLSLQVDLLNDEDNNKNHTFITLYCFRSYQLIDSILTSHSIKIVKTSDLFYIECNKCISNKRVLTYYFRKIIMDLLLK